MSGKASRSRRLRGVLLLGFVVLAALSAAGCTHYGDPRAEVIVTSNRVDAGIYLVPADVPLPKPPTRSTMDKYAVGSTSAKRGIWVHYGVYWLVLEKDGTWSQPVEFEVRYDYLNKVHVEF